jgi:hypothetical protein
VVFNGRGGRWVEHLWQEIDEIINLSPDHIIVDIGTNDLASGRVPPGQIADAVYAFGRHLVISCNVRSVHIAPIFRRLPNARNTCPQFNDKVTIYYQAIQALCRQSQERVLCFTFERMSEEWPSYLDRSDSVHFNRAPSAGCTVSGSFKYYKAIKMVIYLVLRM